MSRDPYTVLGVDPDATEAELKKAYRKAAREWHPDRNKSPEAESRFKEIAAAWEILKDPVARRRHRLTQARGVELAEEFLLDVADAIERAETWIREAVLPHYARYWRGHGAEMATRLFADLDTLLVPQSLSKHWWQRPVQRRADKVVVTVMFGRARDLSVVRHGVDLTQIIVLPQALWDRGFRESSEIDDAVMRILLARFAQAMGPAHAPGNEGTWDEAVEQARAYDAGLVFRSRLRWAGWSAVGIVIAIMLTAAVQGW